MTFYSRVCTRAFSVRHLKKRDVFDFIVLCVFVYLLSDFARRFLEIKVKYTNIFAVFSIIALWIIFYLSKIDNNRNKIFIPFSSVAIFVAYFCIFYKSTFGDIDFGAIVFHIKYGFEGANIDGYFSKSLKYISLFIILIITFSYLIARSSWFRWFDRILVLPVLLATPVASYAFGFLLYASEGDTLVAEYVPPRIVGVSDKGKTKNLVIIYAESAERTFSDLRDGSKFFGDMRKVAAGGVDVKGIRQVENTGWTIAGMVASQCGVPLQPAGSLRRNDFGARDSFLPNMICLGDILRENGYSLSFMGGADLAFAGKGKFHKQHGYSEVFGLTELQHRAGDYLNDWGLYDDTLFELAGEHLEKLAGQKQPFVLSILTVGGHFPEGFPTKTCIDRFGDVHKQQILFSMKCTGFHIRQFLENAERKKLLENTVVVVMSDHLVMKNAVSHRLDQRDRMNFFTARAEHIIPEVHFKNSTTLDIFPTLLELVGYEVSDRRAGLGVSLFSPESSLIEKFGEDELNNMIRYGYDLSGMLWVPGETLPDTDVPIASVSQ